MPSKISFSAQRKAFANNIASILKKLDYSVITFSLKLNSLLGERASTLVSTSEVTSWINNQKLPSLYLLTKISQLFNTSIDTLLSPTFDIDSFNGRSFSTAISATVSAKKERKTAINNKNTEITNKENNPMTTTISVSKTRLTSLRETTRGRTDSKNANYLFVDALDKSKHMLKDIAAKTGISTRSLRDYAYYGTAVPADRAVKLMKVMNTNARNLGLYFDKDSDSYRHASIKVAK